MGTYDKIEHDMRSALKESDSLKLSVLRMVVAAAKTQAIDKKVATLAESDVIQILKRQIKQRRESIEQFRNGNRDDLADKESKELAILEKYVPEQMDEAAIDNLVREAVKETGASTRADMGRLMKAVMEKAGGRADGKVISQVVTKYLK